MMSRPLLLGVKAKLGENRGGPTPDVDFMPQLPNRAPFSKLLAALLPPDMLNPAYKTLHFTCIGLHMRYDPLLLLILAVVLVVAFCQTDTAVDWALQR